jgi:exopolysaccharide biosynthesis polyprenyl glycosylphosphotransferase
MGVTGLSSVPEHKENVSEPLAIPSTAGWGASIWRRRGLLLALMDFALILAIFLFAYYLRFHVRLGFIPLGELQSGIFWDYFHTGVVLTVLWVFFLWRDGAYAVILNRQADGFAHVQSVLESGVYSVGMMMVVSFLYRQLLLSRQVYLITGVLAAAGLIILRWFMRWLDMRLAAGGLTVQRLVVAGAGQEVDEFMSRLSESGGTTRCVGFLDIGGKACGRVDEKAVCPLLGELESIREAYQKVQFDKLVLSSSAVGLLSQSGSDRFLELVNFCEEKRISLYTLSGQTDVAVSHHEAGSFAGLPLARVQDASLHPLYAVVKRFMDIVVSLIVLVVVLPLWVAVAVAIKVTSPGPVFFVQTRIGLHGKTFRIIKFRTMVQDAEARLKELVDVDKLKTPGFKIKDDPRVTSIGRFLRRFSLDEIPQILNVLKGDMSLVGPRPEMAELVAKYTPEQRRRLKAKPGMTGYQQVMARGIPLSEGVEYDLVYLKRQSLLLDLYIMAKTVFVVIWGSGVTH